MDKDDIPKGISWIGNIILEAFDEMCHDVDELMKQAESQIVTVGTNVINFFSELDVVLGDALSESSTDKKLGTPSVSSMVVKTDDAVGIKSLVDTARGCGDGLHVGSVGSVNSVVSSSLSVEETNVAIRKKKIHVRTFDKKHLRIALQDTELDCGAKSIIPISDPVRQCYALKDMSTSPVDVSSKVPYQSSNEDQEKGMDSGDKLLIPEASDDVGRCDSFMDTEDRSTNLVNISAKDSDNKTDSSNASEEIGLDSEAKLLISTSDDIGEFNSFMETVIDMSSSKSSDGILSAAVDMDNEKSTAHIEPCPAYTSAISGVSNCNVAANLSRSVTEPEGVEQGNISGYDELEATMPFTKRNERENVVTESGLQTLGSLKNVELGEGCIADCTELECSSGEAVNSWSYKKTLDAFASKMRFLKKNNNDEEKNSSAILSLPDKSNLPNYEFCDADWEVV